MHGHRGVGTHWRLRELCTLQLEELARTDADERAARLKAAVVEKQRLREERAARGEAEHESDLEDDDVDLDAAAAAAAGGGSGQQQV